MHPLHLLLLAPQIFALLTPAIVPTLPQPIPTESTTLQIPPYNSELTLQWSHSHSATADDITAYQLEYAVLPNVMSLADTTGEVEESYMWEVAGTDVGLFQPGATIQLLTIKADSSISGTDTYQLALQHGGVGAGNSHDHESVTVTPPIPAAATAAELKTALESLENIQSVQVRRCDDLTTIDAGVFGYMADCPYSAVGGYTYHIVFYPTVEVIRNSGTDSSLYTDSSLNTEGYFTLNDRLQKVMPLTSEKVPLLTVYKNQLGAAWTGAGQQISVQRGTRTTVHPSVCATPLPSPYSTSNNPLQCSHTLTTLLPGTRYIFRLRATTAALYPTYTPPGPVSTLVTIAPLHPPSTPQAPRVAGITATVINVALTAPISPDTPPTTEFTIQTTDPTAPNTWRHHATIPAAANGLGTATLTALSPSTQYRVRYAAVNTIGTSPYSSPTPLLTTLGTSPSAPSAPIVTPTGSTALLVTWAPVSGDVTTYSVHSRVTRAGNTDDMSWSHTLTVPAVETSGLNAVWSVTTTGTSASPVTGGSFWLTHANGMTIPIAYDAEAGDVKAALEALPSVGTLVVRRHTPNNARASAPMHGGYTWVIEFAEVGRLSYGGSGGVSVGKEEVVGGGVTVAHTQRSTLPVYATTLEARVAGLTPFTRYDVCVKAANDDGVGPCSTITGPVRTAGEQHAYALPGERTTHMYYDHTKTVVSSSYVPAGTSDVDYVSYGGGVASYGGLENLNGEDGFVVITAYGEGMSEGVRTVFYYSGNAQTYHVDELAGFKASKSKTDRYVDVKVWGAGGAGGHGFDNGGRGVTLGDRLNSPSTDFSKGGGGGFVQARVKVVPGETLTVVVGGGGIKMWEVDAATNTAVRKLGGKGGFNGGGDGGHGVDGGGGGGGGGMSTVLRGTVPLVAAGGGGGGGATDYCCANGGGGGGETASPGEQPALSTPTHINEDEAAGEQVRAEYTGVDESAEPSGYADPRDVNGMPAHHNHLDRGFAPNASYDVLSTGGTGGSLISADHYGLPGVSGSYKVNYAGEMNHVSQKEGWASMDVRTDSAYSKYASPGADLQGGRGADGKEGGGGGGGGFYGGGGGGSGVDGAGGGGGCGFIDYTVVYDADTEALSHRGFGRTGPNVPAPPQVYDVRSTSFQVQWTHPLANGTEIMGFDVRAYDVEISVGREGAADEGGATCDREFYRHAQLRVGVDSVVNTVGVTDLLPDTIYCVRIAAVSRSGGSVETAERVVFTPPKPVNEWEVVNVRRNKVVVSGRGDASGVMTRPHIDENVETRGQSKRDDAERSYDGPFEKSGHAPSARRGTSMVVLDDARYVYLFGGMAEGYHCDDGGTSDTTNEGDLSGGVANDQCRREAGVVNDLWRLDLVTSVWEVVFDNGNSVGPVGREGHSAHKLEDGTMLIFGGKTLTPGDVKGDTGVNYFLGDLWELDVGATSDYVVQGGGGEASALPVTIEEGVMQYLRVNATVGGSDMCIESVKVNVEWEHDCVKDLQFALYGPGPRTGDKNWNPQSRGDRVLLMDYLAGEVACEGAMAGTVSTEFLDSAEGKVNGDWSKASGYNGQWGPIDSLDDRFAGTIGDGEWTLEVYDKNVDGAGGVVHDWSLEFVMSECSERREQWTDLSTRDCERSWFDEASGGVTYGKGTGACPDPSVGTGPVARWMHTTVAVKNVLYVMGGNNGGKLDDVWAYEKGAGTWKQMVGAFENPTWIGRSVSLSRWGAFGFGGLWGNAEMNLEGRVWKMDVGLKVWTLLGEMEGEGGVNGGGWDGVEARKWRSSGKVKGVASPEVWEAAPQKHYLAEVVLVGDDKGASSSGVVLGGDAEPQILHFGGDMGGTRGKYSGDLRRLLLRAEGARDRDEELQLLRKEVCDWRLNSGSTGDLLWRAGCGVGAGEGTAGCELEEILIRAWCEGSFQTVHNI